ncbi:DMT family transporter [Trebonia sp.]|uniref:DMT family transporter n=1 Tax=Trebonia sp. TaxID=2767075 RepID=UPI002637D600|nr:DMT family transporter [Trebonia sp.]
MTIIYALLAGLCNALNVTAQHLGSISSSKKSKGWRFVVSLLGNPLWLAGWGALAGGFVFQALALHAGQMSVVQSLLVTELVFALGLRRIWLRQSIRGVTWWAAALTCVALSVFLATSEPQGGTHYPASHAWVTGAWGTVGVAALLTLLGMRGSTVRRTALVASATAMMWALVATLVKTMTDTWSEFGVGGMFLHWPVYALAAAGLGAEVLQQTTLRIGPLSVSQPLLVIINPIVSIALSVWIFEEYFTTDVPRLALGSVAFAAMCASAAVLTRTAPTTMSASDISPAPSTSAR